MALEFETQNLIPEGLRDDFIEIGGKWRPKGFVPESVHEEMKQRAERSRQRLGELEEAAKRWDGIDPDKARKAEAEAERLRKELASHRTGKSDDELAKAVEERWGHERKKLQGELEARDTNIAKLEGRAAETQEQLHRLLIDTEVDRAAAELEGFRPSAATDARMWARNLFAFDEVGGQAVPVMKTSDGHVKQGEKGPLTIKEWLAGTKNEPLRGHWWAAPGSGGGATNGTHTSGGGRSMKRGAWEGLSAKARHEFIREGGVLTD